MSQSDKKTVIRTVIGRRERRTKVKAVMKGTKDIMNGKLAELIMQEKSEMQSKVLKTVT